MKAEDIKSINVNGRTDIPMFPLLTFEFSKTLISCAPPVRKELDSKLSHKYGNRKGSLEFQDKQGCFQPNLNIKIKNLPGWIRKKY